MESNNKIIDGYVINLESDLERLNSIKNEFNDTCVNLKIFKAIKHKKGWIGCLKSHLSLIKMAKENNMDMILIIEDDGYIENREYFQNNFEKIIDFLKNNMDKWNIFHGGPNINKNSKINNFYSSNPLLFNINLCVSTTFIIYNKNCYDFFINFLKYDDNKLKNTNKIDMLIYHNFYCLTTFPCLAWQKNFYSNIDECYRDDLQDIKNNRDKIFKRLLKNVDKK